MPVHNDHVSCCGISHAVGFHGTSARDQRHALKDIDEMIEDEEILFSSDCGRLLEVTLTDTQLREQPLVCKGLKERGFKLVSRFKNRNSGNYVNVLHLRPHNRLHGSPYWKED